MTALTLSQVRPSLGPNMANPLDQHDLAATYQKKLAAPEMVAVDSAPCTQRETMIL